MLEQDQERDEGGMGGWWLSNKMRWCITSPSMGPPSSLHRSNRLPNSLIRTRFQNHIQFTVYFFIHWQYAHEYTYLYT